MARSRHVVVLALIMLAMIGLSCAADPPRPSDDDYEEDDDSEFLVGTRRGDPPSANGGVVAAPIGGPVPPGAFDGAPSAASSVQFSAIVGTAVTAAVAGIFYF